MNTLQKTLLTFAVAVVAWLGQPGTALAAYPANNQAHGLVRVATLTPAYGFGPIQNEPKFGFSVAVDGGWLAVGAPNAYSDLGTYGVARHGVVSLFHREAGQWQLKQQIEVGQYGDSQCGYSVAMDLPHLIIGCPGDSFTNPSDERGSLYWYQLSGGQWSYEYHWNGIPGARCGFSVALAGTGLGSAYAAYGCPYDNNEAGTVWTWRYTPTGGWTIDTGLSASDAASGDLFGRSLSMDYESGFIGTYWLAVGAPLKDVGQSGGLNGKTYVFSGGGFGWAEDDSMIPPSPTTFVLGGEIFGRDVAIRDDRLLIGSPHGTLGSTACDDFLHCGITQLYTNTPTDWSNTNSTYIDDEANTGGNPPGPQIDMEFGDAVAFGFNGMAAISAPGTDGFATVGVLQEDGYVELRAAGNTNLRLGELRPVYRFRANQGHFGDSLDFGREFLAVGVPDSNLPTDQSGDRFGSVNIYQSDRIFAADLERSPVLDPSFEAIRYPPNATRYNNFWWGEQTGLNGNPPIYLGGNPHSGDAVVLFGATGSTGLVDGKVLQFVRIPTDATGLHFFKQITEAPIGFAALYVRIDGDLIANFDLDANGVDPSYVSTSVDLTDYADGKTHLLTFKFVYSGGGSGTDGSTWIDDVTIY